MELLIAPDGVVRCVYGEELDLSALGQIRIRRVSRVESDQGGLWWADLSPVQGPKLGPFPRRSQAVAAELQWLIERLVHAPFRPSRTGAFQLKETS